MQSAVSRCRQSRYGSEYQIRFEIKIERINMEVQLDMYQTLAASVLVLMLGSYLKQKYMFWKNSVSRHRLSGDCCLQSSPASVTAAELWRFLLMIH